MTPQEMIPLPVKIGFLRPALFVAPEEKQGEKKFFINNPGIATVMPVPVLFLVLKTYTGPGTHLRKHQSPDEPVALAGF